MTLTRRQARGQDVCMDDGFPCDCDYPDDVQFSEVPLATPIEYTVSSWPCPTCLDNQVLTPLEVSSKYGAWCPVCDSVYKIRLGRIDGGARRD